MSRRTLSLALLLAAGLAALATFTSPADALISTHGDGIEGWLIQRGFDIRNDPGKEARKQRSAISKASTKLGKESTDLTGDAKVLSKVLKPLIKPFTGDAEFDDVAADVNTAIEADLLARRASLEGLRSDLNDHKAQNTLDNKVAGADKKIAKMQAATDPAKRAKLAWQAFKKLDGIDKKILKAIEAGDHIEGFLFVTGDNNHAARVFRPTRQTDDTSLVPDGEGKARNQFEDGAQTGEVGNFLLILNWTDSNSSGTVDRVRVQLFPLIGIGEAPEAWIVDTFSLGIGSAGISVSDTPNGVRLNFNGTTLAPDAGSNSAAGTLFLNGSLLLEIE